MILKEIHYYSSCQVWINGEVEPHLRRWGLGTQTQACCHAGAHTVKDAHPLPHQADGLAVIGGNVFFSMMDLTSGYYNVEVHEQDRRFTAFMSPFGLNDSLKGYITVLRPL